MTARAVAALVLVLAGAILGVPAVAVLGIVALTVEIVHAIWKARGLDGVRYVRHLATNRLPWGEDLPLAIEVWNRKGLPLSWFRVDDATSLELTVRERPTIETDQLGVTLRNTWTLAPYERVTRHLRLTSRRRGVYGLGPATVSVGDLFARSAAMVELPRVDSVVVLPRTVPTTAPVRPDRWGDADRAVHGLLEDPSRFAGIRPYAPGDPIRRVHHRLSARLREPVTKRFEPSRRRDVLIALDLQVSRGPSWSLSIDDDAIEGLFVVAASIVRALAAEHTAFGLTAAGFAGSPRRFADIPVSSSPGQAERVLELLARLASSANARYETLLARIERRIPDGTTVLALTARDPRPFATAFRRLERAGFDVVVVAAGPDAAANAAAARGAGFSVRAAVLDGPWPSATTLAVG